MSLHDSPPVLRRAFAMLAKAVSILAPSLANRILTEQRNPRTAQISNYIATAKATSFTNGCRNTYDTDLLSGFEVWTHAVQLGSGTGKIQVYDATSAVQWLELDVPAGPTVKVEGVTAPKHGSSSGDSEIQFGHKSGNAGDQLRVYGSSFIREIFS